MKTRAKDGINNSFSPSCIVRNFIFSNIIFASFRAPLPTLQIHTINYFVMILNQLTYVYILKIIILCDSDIGLDAEIKAKKYFREFRLKKGTRRELLISMIISSLQYRTTEQQCPNTSLAMYKKHGNCSNITALHTFLECQ